MKSTGFSFANDILGGIQGAERVVNGDARELTGVEVIDKRRLRVRLVSPRFDFPMLLAHPVAYVLKRDNVARWDGVWNAEPLGMVFTTEVELEALPVGAGPFKLTRFARVEDIDADPYGSRCVLARNEHYWDTPSHIDGVVINLSATSGAEASVIGRQRDEFSNGNLDFILIGDSLSEGIYINLPPRMSFLALNPSRPPFDDIHFRRALAKTAEVDEKLLTGIVSNPHRIVSASLASPGDNIRGYDFDPADGKQELEASLYQDDFLQSPIEFYTLDDSEASIGYLWSVFKAWREALGIEVKVNEFDIQSDVDDDSPHLLLPPLNELGMVEVHVWPHYPHPHAVLIKFASAFRDQDAPAEIAEIRRLIADAAADPDAAERRLKYSTIEQRILDQALAIPLLALETQARIMIQPWVHGLKFPKYHGSAFKDVWIDDTAPERALP